MHAQDMLDYVLGQLDGPDRERAEEEIASDPALARTLDRLGRAVHQILDDGDPIELPAGLAYRTLSFVAENRRRRSISDFVPVRVPFRWTDFAVAASIFAASLITLLPAFHRARERMDQAGCVFNLQQLGVGLAQYAALHGHYPYVPPGQPNAEAGTFAATLHESGLLGDLSTLDCPCNGVSHKAERLPALERLTRLRRESPDQVRRLLGWDYAYHVGFRQGNGRPGPIPAHLAMPLPLVADQPPHEGRQILDGNSPNHNWRGQNVLFSDGHVNWFDSRRVSADDADMFLNDENQPGPGVDMHDAALVPSLFPFHGR